MDHIVAKVLVDNGSSLNVMPKSTLNKLPFNVSHLRPSSMIVRDFDGTRRNVIGEIDLPVQIGPHPFYITFQVMDINLTYNCLLSRPWIHLVGVVPLTLVGFLLQLLCGPIFLYTNMFKGNPICRKAHWIVQYLKLKQMNMCIELRELVLDRVKFRNKALLKETLIIDGLEQN